METMSESSSLIGEKLGGRQLVPTSAPYRSQPTSAMRAKTPQLHKPKPPKQARRNPLPTWGQLYSYDSLPKHEHEQIERLKQTPPKLFFPASAVGHQG